MKRNSMMKDIIVPIVVAIITAIGGVIGGGTIERIQTNNMINSYINQNENQNISPAGLINNINYSSSNEEPLTALINAYIELSKENAELIQELASLKAEDSRGEVNVGSYDLFESLDTGDVDWMDQCPPFKLGGTSGSRQRKIFINDGESFNAGGKEFSKGFTLYSYGDNFASFNLEQNYSSVMFYVGHVSGTIFEDILEMKVFINAEYYNTYSIDMTDAATKIEIPLNYARSMKIEITGSCDTVGFGGGHFYK